MRSLGRHNPPNGPHSAPPGRGHWPFQEEAYGVHAHDRESAPGAAPTPSPGFERRARKQLGKFYTPDAIADAMVRWAVRGARDRVLDPSYGGCAFFAAARSRLRTLGARRPERQLFGVDVDPEAAVHLAALLNGHGRRPNFLIADFLGVRPGAFGMGMQAVVGNPPYVRHHALSDDQLRAARTALELNGDALDGRASYWAYFVLHAVQFLDKGGRLAFVLPAAVLNANYASPVRAALAQCFGSVRIAVLRERVFEGVDELAVIVLANGWRQGPARCTLTVLDESSEIPTWCGGRGAPGDQICLAPAGVGWKDCLLTPGASRAFAEAVARPGVTTLGDLARVRIGTVTGANRFFVLSAEEVRRERLPESTLGWVLDSASRLTSLEVTNRDLTRALRDGHRVRLFDPGQATPSKRARAYVEGPLGSAAAKAGHCTARQPWYALTDAAAPDAFLSYVNHLAPRLALNLASASCTNALHRLWWKRPRSLADQRLVALSFLTSLSGLSAELRGRSYGGGVLKLEIGEAAAIHVAFPAIESLGDRDQAYKIACQWTRQGEWKAARSLADQVVLETGLGIPRRQTQQLARAQDALRAMRLREPR